MPSGIYKRKPLTEEQKAILAEKMSKIGKKYGKNNGFKKGHPDYLTEKSRQVIKDKLSKARRGVLLGKNPEHSKRMTGKKQTKEHIEKTILSRKKYFDKIGRKTNKNKLVRTSKKYKKWRESVFARDNWTCQYCGKRNGTELNAHHIKEFYKCEELRFELKNGITLCKDCHRKKHKHKF